MIVLFPYEGFKQEGEASRGHRANRYLTWRPRRAADNTSAVSEA